MQEDFNGLCQHFSLSLYYPNILEKWSEFLAIVSFSSVTSPSSLIQTASLKIPNNFKDDKLNDSFRFLPVWLLYSRCWQLIPFKYSFTHSFSKYFFVAYNNFFSQMWQWCSWPALSLDLLPWILFLSSEGPACICPILLSMVHIWKKASSV